MELENTDRSQSEMADDAQTEKITEKSDLLYEFYAQNANIDKRTNNNVLQTDTKSKQVIDRIYSFTFRKPDMHVPPQIFQTDTNDSTFSTLDRPPHILYDYNPEDYKKDTEKLVEDIGFPSQIFQTDTNDNTRFSSFGKPAYILYEHNLSKSQENESQECTALEENITEAKNQTENVPQKTMNGKKYACEMCNKTFPKLYNLNCHLEIHYQVKYECDICLKKFSSKSGLTVHRTIHTGQMSYQCHICPERFRVKIQLDRHLLSHSGERIYKCELCDKTFWALASLRDHILIHTGDRPHICDICNQRFMRKSHLNDHLLRHTGEKPHICSVCKKQFVKKCHLVTHMATHTGAKPFECMICAKKFTRKFSYTNHMKMHHPNEVGAAIEPYKTD